MSVKEDAADVGDRSGEATRRALLRWAGSKRALVPMLAGHVPRFPGRYIEPFVGSAALFFYLRPRQAVLGDINSALIKTYITLRSCPKDVVRELHSMPPSDRGFYYRLRAEDESKLSAARRAARFIYLNRYCFNGLYRTNRAGRFNVPFSGRRNGPLPSSEILLDAARLFRRAQLVAADFEATLESARPGDFVYLDPPYWISEKRMFREYNAEAFSEKHLSRLTVQLRRLEELGIPFMLSYFDTPEADELTEGRNVHRASVRRNIAGFGKSRTFDCELVVTPKFMASALA
jgi:DNA adenine methylase